MFFPTTAAGLIRLCWQLPLREGCQLLTVIPPNAGIDFREKDNISPVTWLLPSRTTSPGLWVPGQEGVQVL